MPFSLKRILSGSFFRYDDHLDHRVDVGVQVHADLEFANMANRTFALDHFILVESEAGGSERIGDVTRTD